MRILVDENVPALTIQWLRDQGHAVTEARFPPLRKADDDVLWGAAQREQALVVSTDKGFTDKWSEQHWGILIVRLRQPNRQKIHDRIVLAMGQRNTAEDWRGVLVVMRDRVQSVRTAPDRQSGA